MPGCNTMIIKIINDFEISQEFFARTIGSSARTVSRWVTNNVRPLPIFQEKIQKLALIDRKLRTVFKREAIPKWLQTQNETLGGELPLNLLKNGRYDEILAVIAQLEEGVFI